jgi:hypothetical protein
MNKDSQHKKIKRFLKGKGANDVDPFCIYQWIDRSYYECWYDIAISLSAHLPPNSLDENYQKRLNFLLIECRAKLKEEKTNIEQFQKEVESMFEEYNIKDPKNRKRIIREIFKEAGFKVVFSKIENSGDSPNC